MPQRRTVVLWGLLNFFITITYKYSIKEKNQVYFQARKEGTQDKGGENKTVGDGIRHVTYISKVKQTTLHAHHMTVVQMIKN